MSNERGDDTVWAALADVRRKRDAYVCQVCLGQQRLTAAGIVHHIVPVHVTPDWRLVLEKHAGDLRAVPSAESAEERQQHGGATNGRAGMSGRRNRVGAAVY